MWLGLPLTATQIPNVSGDCGWAAVVFRRSILTDADNGVLTAFVPRP